MQYHDVLGAIVATERQLKRIKKDCSDLCHYFERYGCYDEDAAEDLWRKQTTLYKALNQLYAELPTAAL